MATLVRVSPESSRADLATCMLHLCDRAKMLSRNGRRGTDSTAYSDLHETLDDLLTAWQKAK